MSGGRSFQSLMVLLYRIRSFFHLILFSYFIDFVSFRYIFFSYFTEFVVSFRWISFSYFTDFVVFCFRFSVYRYPYILPCIDPLLVRPISDVLIILIYYYKSSNKKIFFFKFISQFFLTCRCSRHGVTAYMQPRHWLLKGDSTWRVTSTGKNKR